MFEQTLENLTPATLAAIIVDLSVSPRDTFTPVKEATRRRIVQDAAYEQLVSIVGPQAARQMITRVRRTGCAR